MEFSDEEMRNMNPEQVADLQKKNCIFCHIVSGRVATKKVYEDDKCLAILDINPANPGHVLLLPKEHYAIMPLVPEDLIAHMFTVAKHLSQAQLKALKAQGTTIMAANGMVAGQRAPHFMIHIIPRKEGDDVGFSFPTRQLPQADLEKLAASIRRRANALFGIEGKEPLELDVKPAKIKASTVQAEFEEEKEEEAMPEKEHEKAQEESNKQKPKVEPAPAPKPSRQPAKKAETKKPEPKQPKSKNPKSQSPKEKPKEEPAKDPDLDLISRLF